MPKNSDALNSLLQQNNSLPPIEEVKGTYRNPQAQAAYDQPVNIKALIADAVEPTGTPIEERLKMFAEVNARVNDTFNTDEDFSETYLNYQTGLNMPIDWEQVDQIKKSQASSNVVKAQAAYKDVKEVLNTEGWSEIKNRKGINKNLLSTWDFLKKSKGVNHAGVWGDKSHQKRKSFHNTGDAIDLKFKDKQEATNIVNILVNENQNRRVREIIYNRKRWTPEKGWKNYNGKNPHTSHIHAAFYK